MLLRAKEEFALARSCVAAPHFFSQVWSPFPCDSFFPCDFFSLAPDPSALSPGEGSGLMRLLLVW